MATGKTTSLNPSISNWKFECESHYWINNSEVEWARKWSKEEISQGKINEKKRREKYYKQTNESSVEKDILVDSKGSFWHKISLWFSR